MEPACVWMNGCHTPDLGEMEDMTFGGEPGKWTMKDYDNALRRRNWFGVAVVIADDPATIAGMIFQLPSKRIQLHRLIVRRDARGLGFGTMLLDRLHNKLTDKRPVAVCNVPEQCLPMQCLLRSCGWLATGERRGFIHFEVTRERLGEFVIERIADGNVRTVGL